MQKKFPYYPIYIDIEDHAVLIVGGGVVCARKAETMPWPERDARMWQIAFPQMANWLPPDEADQLRFEFAQEMQRLARAA